MALPSSMMKRMSDKRYAIVDPTTGYHLFVMDQGGGANSPSFKGFAHIRWTDNGTSRTGKDLRELLMGDIEFRKPRAFSEDIVIDPREVNAWLIIEQPKPKDYFIDYTDPNLITVEEYRKYDGDVF